MHVIQARNVSEAYLYGMQHLTGFGVREQSRAGEVLVATTPVTTVYNRPAERVLFDSKRDANPFFHLMESVWMLAGARDARWLDRWVKDFSSRFAEDNGEAHGAYGYRWRQHFERDTMETSSPVIVDQLVEASQVLYDNPASRQAVISMWDPAVDLGAVKRDIPCNDLIMLRGRSDHLDKVHELDITVACRSNDAVWGAYGANAVHFSVMAEVLAGLAGMRLGRYYQVSNNFHVYVDVLQKVWPSRDHLDLYAMGHVRPTSILESGTYNRERLRSEALGLLDSCQSFVITPDPRVVDWKSRWLARTVVPMYKVYELWRAGERDKAIEMAGEIEATDWRWAASAWMARRLVRRGVPETRSA